MIQIIGVSETVSLEEGLVSRKELKVLGPDGREHSIEVPPEVIKKLLSIWAGGDGVSTPMAPRAPARVARPREVASELDAAPTPDIGEVSSTFGGDVEPTDEVPTLQAPAVHATPRFMATEDDDGQQI